MVTSFDLEELRFPEKAVGLLLFHPSGGFLLITSRSLSRIQVKILLRNELVTFNLNRVSFLDESSFKSRESRNHQRYNYFVIIRRRGKKI